MFNFSLKALVVLFFTYIEVLIFLDWAVSWSISNFIIVGVFGWRIPIEIVVELGHALR